MFTNSRMMTDIVGNVYNDAYGINAKTKQLDAIPGDFEMAWFIEKHKNKEGKYPVQSVYVKRKNGSYSSDLFDFALSNPDFYRYV